MNKMFIQNAESLIRDLTQYQKMFPDTYTTLEDINKQLTSSEENDISIEVSPQYKERVYKFNKNNNHAEYLGLNMF